MTRVLALLLVLAVTGTGVQTWRLHSTQTTLAQERADRAAADAKQAADRAAYEAALNAGVRKATDAYLSRAAEARRTAAGLDAAYSGVLDAIAQAGGTADDPAAACRADAERVRVLTGLLAEGAGLASEGGSRVEGLAAKLAGLQDHARAVATSASGSSPEVPVSHGHLRGEPADRPGGADLQ